MDNLLSLAFSLYNSSGVYALLLGSGVSRSVGIPTGWDITQDIIKVFEETGNDPPNDHSYDSLLASIGQTQAERNSFLRKYFEPTDEEREQGKKVPSKAHKAIAQLVKSGYIKVILTTNFDRLIENALEEIGITPDVISSDDMLQGSPPIRHSKITVIKLHGDYRDIRTLNTEEELANYSQEKNEFLDTIFDEYGLIVCGWSARWDLALRDAIYRIKPRWYGTYWIDLYPPSDEANEVISHRKATFIQSHADDFFTGLQRNVEALEKITKQHPLSVAVAVEQVKRLLPHEHTQIELEDLLRSEAKNAYDKFVDFKPEITHLDGASEPKDWDEFYDSQLSNCFTLTEVFLNMAMTLCWYGNGQHRQLLTEITSYWARATELEDQHTSWQRTPALLLIYACSIASVHRSHWTYLRAVTLEPIVLDLQARKQLPILNLISKTQVFYHGYVILERNPMRVDSYDLFSVKLRRELYPLFKSYIPSEAEFSQLFDLVELLLSIITLDLNLNSSHWLLPHNAAMKGYAHYRYKWEYIFKFWEEGGKQGGNWGLLSEIFDGNYERLKNTLLKYREVAMNEQRWFPPHDIPDLHEKYLQGIE